MLRNDKGMTLVEIMIVLVILGGLSAILITNVVDKMNNAKYKEAKLQMTKIQDTLNSFYADCNFFPTTDMGLEVLVEDPGESCPDWGPEPYMKRVPKDPWGGDFYYEYDEEDGGEPILISYGGDKREGGKASDKDISSENF
ncbi:MAG: type II secretion system major pseudopilin GspG [Bdellovibrionaceae bacterium]|jgi:general secretion pathway protein G|nr:type II secretion system major pseudopilin GspG [Pseudobdellovibrionaceae bacterium]